MKHLKILGLVAVAAMALMAFAASSASATMLYNGETNATLGVGQELDFSLKSATKAKLTETTGGALDECSTSTVKGAITNAGSSTTTVSGSISDEVKEGKTITGLTWGGCTFPTTTTVPGGLEVHWISGTTNGTLTSNSEIKVTINTVLFGTCVYGVEPNTDLGVLTGSTTAAAEFHANAVALRLTGSQAVCPATSNWKATYVSTTPSRIYVEES